MIELLIFGMVCVGLLIYARKQMAKDDKEINDIIEMIDKLKNNNKI